MKEKEYMGISANIIPNEFLQEYNLCDKIKYGYIYARIDNSMYGLPQAGLLANQLLKKRLAKYGYHEIRIPGLWKHVYRPVDFTLIVDDFGVKFVETKNAEYLINTLKQHYRVEIDWTGSK